MPVQTVHEIGLARTVRQVLLLAAAGPLLLATCRAAEKKTSASRPTGRSTAAAARANSDAGGDAGGDAPSGPRELHVNGDTITVEEVLEPIMPGLAESAKGEPAEQVRKRVIERASAELINQVQDVLLHQEASKEVTDQMQTVVDRVVDQEIKDRVNREFGGRQARFEVHLASLKLTLDDARDKVRRRLVIIKHLQDRILPRIASPTRRELMDYYDAHIADYTQPEVRELFMIEIPRADDEAEARSAIDQAQEQLQQGRAFEDVAREFSKGLRAAEGGNWATIKSPLQGRYARPSEAFYQLSSHEISDIVETDDAFFIVKAGEVRPARTTAFAEVQAELSERYRGVQFELLRAHLLQELLEKAVIEPSEDLFLKQVVAEAMKRLSAE